MTSTATPAVTLTDEEEILRLHKDWVTANRTGDTTWCRNNMAGGEDGVRLFNTNGSEYRGVEHWCSLWDVYRDVIKGDKATREPPRFTSEEVDVNVDGDMAWVSYWFRAKARLPEGKSIPELSRGTEVWRRTDDGWKMVHGHWSFGGPGAPADGHGPELHDQEWAPLH